MEYHIVEANNITDLTTMIENYLKIGWQLQGGVSVACFEMQNSPTDDSKKQMFKYCQAIAKKSAPQD